MSRKFSIKTVNELIDAINSAKNCSGAVINIENNLEIIQPIEISGCENIEITSENCCTITGGYTNICWQTENNFLTFYTETEPRMLIINGKPAKKNFISRGRISGKY